MTKSAGWKVSRLVDLTAPGPRALSPTGGVRFVADDGTVLDVNDLLFFGPDVDSYRSFDAELQPAGMRLRRAKVQLDLGRFNDRIGEVVIRTRDAGRLRGIDAATWHAAAQSALDAIYRPEPVEALSSAPGADPEDAEAEDEEAA